MSDLTYVSEPKEDLGEDKHGIHIVPNNGSTVDICS